MNNTQLAIDIYIIWSIGAPLVLVAAVLWQSNRITELQKELKDVRETLGRRIVNSRDEIFEELNLIKADVEFIDNEQEEMKSNINCLDDRLKLLEVTEDDVDDIFDDDEYNRKLHEVIDSIDGLFEEKKDGD